MEVPEQVKQGLSNLKSSMRGKKGKKTKAPAMPKAISARPSIPRVQLEKLEGCIDDCIAMANTMGPDGLMPVMMLMRKAQREIVWMMGH